MHTAMLGRLGASALAAGLLVAGVVGWSAPASATVIYPSSVTASSAYVGFPASDAIDTGSNYLVTDWATNGGGVAGYLDMTLPTVESLLSVTLTERTTGGAGSGNGHFGGSTADFATEFELQAYSDGSFSTTVGGPIVFTETAPVAPASPAAFTFSGSLGGLSAQFVRYQILAINGSTSNTTANPGLANIEFSIPTPVPEPRSALVFGAGVLMLLGVMAAKRTISN